MYLCRDNEVLMLTCEFDLKVTEVDLECIKVDSIKSLHRCTSETSEIESLMENRLTKFSIQLKSPFWLDGPKLTVRKLFIYFRLSDKRLDDTTKVIIQNGRQRIQSSLG